MRRAASVHPVTAVQMEYSLWQRDIETEILPLCRSLGISLIPYSPLGRGFLTGTLMDTTSLDTNDFRRELPRFQGTNYEKNKQLVIQLAELAKAKKCSTAQLSLAWLLAQGEDIIPIPSTKKQKYLEENINAVTVHLDQDELKELNTLFAPNKIHGDKYPAHLNFEN